MATETITVVGGRIIEGFANGMSVPKIAKLLGFSDSTIKSHAKELYRDFGIAETVEHAGTLCVAKCVAAGLLQQPDMKQPGTAFQFTMAPGPTSLISFRDTCKPGKSVLQAWPTIPVEPYTMPTAKTPLHTPFSVSAEHRTYLSYFSVGRTTENMRAASIRDKGRVNTVDAIKYELTLVYKQLAASSKSQAVARAAFLGIIDIPPNYFTELNPEPTHYEDDFEAPPLMHFWNENPSAQALPQEGMSPLFAKEN